MSSKPPPPCHRAGSPRQCRERAAWMTSEVYHKSEDRMNGIVITFARFKARQIIERDWRDEGHKLASIELRDLKAFAIAYVDGHPELVEQAIESVRTNPKLRTLAERHERFMRRLRT